MSAGRRGPFECCPVCGAALNQQEYSSQCHGGHWPEFFEPMKRDDEIPDPQSELLGSGKQLLERLKKAAYLLDEIRAGNAYSENILWHEVACIRAALAKATADA